MTYQVILRPMRNGLPADSVVDENGNTYRQQVIGTTQTIPTGNNLEVLEKLIAGSAQPSTAQKAGLVGYLTAIQAEVNTATVETAVSAL